MVHDVQCHKGSCPAFGSPTTVCQVSPTINFNDPSNAGSVRNLRRVSIQPEPVRFVGIAGQDDNWTIRDAPYFRETGAEVRPLMHGERRHGRGETVDPG